MATEKRLKGYDPITLESFTRHMTKHREPYDQYDMGYVDAVEQIENFLEYNTVDAVEVVFCDDCVKHGGCYTEDVFRLARIEKPYCCVGKKDGDGNGC